METLCQSDYQDLYRVMDGVLLVVNKFKYVLENGKCRISTYSKSRDSTVYAKGCQDQLRKLTKSGKAYDDNTYPKGTVVYYGYLIKKCPVEEYDFQIKTTGDLFSGNVTRLTEILKEITEKIGEYKK